MSIRLQSSQRELSVIQPEIIKVLQEVSATLIGTFELDVLLQNVVETYRKISKASACSIYLIDEEKNRLVMKAGVGYEKDLKGVAEYDLSVDPETLGIGLTAWIALTKQKFSAKTREDLTSHSAWWGKYDGYQYPGDKECKSFIGVPLIVRDKVIGVLKAENKIPDVVHPESYFTPTEEQTFEILANTVAIAIENVRLIEEKRKSQSLRIAESIHKVSAAVVGTFELDGILHRIVETFKEISNAKACSIYLVDDDRRHIRMRAGVGYERDLRYEANYDLTVDPNAPKVGLTVWIVLTKQKFSAKTREDLTSHSAWWGKYDGYQYPGDKECKSFIGVPLLIRDEVIGVLKAENKITDMAHPETYFTLEEEQVFEILSNIAAIVVTNATLIAKEGKQLSRIIELYQIGAMLQEQDDIERLLFSFLTGLTHGKVIGFNRAMYFEYQPVTKQLMGRMAIGPLDPNEGKIIRKEMEIAGGSLTIEACIRTFDDGRKSLDTNLNRLISDTVIDLEKGDPCLELIANGEKTFKEFKTISFSPDLKRFLEKIESESVILIGIAPSKESYNLVFCDNIYDQKPFDQSTKELLIVFIGQMSRALERIQSAEKVKAAKEAAWQEVSAMAAHRLGNILPFTEHRLDVTLSLCNSNKELQNLLKSCKEDMTIAINILNDFKRFATSGRIILGNVDDVNNVLEQIIASVKTDFRDIEIAITYLKQKVIPRIMVDFNAMKDVLLNLLTNTKDIKPKNCMVEIWAELPFEEELNKCGLRPKGKFIKIIYKDNGPGIPDEEKESIFEAFFSHKQGSSGLGLTTVRRIIEQHGGRIFEDGIYGYEARFNIILPIVT